MNNNITIEKINFWANKLMFNLTKEEAETLLNEFDVVVEQMELINKIEGIEKVEPMTFPYVDYSAKLREDIAVPSIATEEVLKNAKETKGDEIKVPRVVAE